MSKDHIYNIAVIGCGAAGMMAAISAAQYEKDIVILERNDVAGKKIPATGNGKCNFTNLNITNGDFYGNDTDTAFKVYEKFNNYDTVSFFESIGILKTDKNGYCYPHSQTAASVRDALVRKINQLGIPVIFDFRVANISYSDKIYISTSKNKGNICSRKLIVAAGGQAQGCFGTDGSMYYYLKKLGHSIITPVPALSGLKLNSKYLSQLSGVRHDCRVSINTGNKTFTEEGEVIFSKNGLSGIPVMNMSRFALRALEEGSTATLSLDLFSDMSFEKLVDYLQSIISNSDSPIGEVLSGVLNIKTVNVLLELTDTASSVSADSLDAGFAKNFAKLAKAFTFEIIGSYGFESAQVTSGGVPLRETDSETLESKICDNLYFAGEILDVDAKCGGYNLQWAWSSGAVAGAYCGGGHFDKSKLC